MSCKQKFVHADNPGQRNQEIKQNWAGTENSNNSPMSFVKK